LSKKIFRTDVKYGDIVTLTDYDMNSVGRLAFVLSVENNDYIEACLLSNLNEFATNYDVLIDNEFTGLGYTLTFQTNLIFNAFITQVQDVLVRLDQGTSDEISKIIHSVDEGSKPKSKKFKIGTTINSRGDMRAFKDNESGVAMKLGLDCFLALSEGLRYIVMSSQFTNETFIKNISSIEERDVILAGNFKEEIFNKNPDNFNAFKGLLNSHMLNEENYDFSEIETLKELENELKHQNLNGWTIDFESNKNDEEIVTTGGIQTKYIHRKRSAA